MAEWHFLYKIVYRDYLVKVQFLYASLYEMRDNDYVLKPKVETIIKNKSPEFSTHI
jgi:hypothetical protein